MKALLIVDVQNDFFPGGALAISGAEAIVEPINRLIERFDLVIATQDYHPKDHVSFSIWPPHCIQGTHGSDFVKGLHLEQIDHIARKGMTKEVDSYSPFFDERGNVASDLDSYLKRHGVDELVVVGVASDYCVKWTVLDALKLGYRVSVVLNGCRGVNPDDEKRAFEQMQLAGAHLQKEF